MDSKIQKIEYRFGKAGRMMPLIAAVAMILWAAVSQSNVNGYVLAFFTALITGVVFTKDEKAYGEALVYGLSKPMFGVIVLAVILAAVSGKLISASGAVQTIAAYVVAAGFTGKLFVAATFLITCLLAFATGTSVGTYFVVIPILFPVGVMAGAAPEFMIGAIVSGAAFGDNLGPISDTTIASSATQHADLGTVVKTRTRYSLPAAAGALLLFLLFSKTTDGSPAIEGITEGAVNPLSLLMLVIPVVIIVLCMMRKHLITALSWGILAGIAVGLLSGIYTINDLIAFPGGFSVSGAVIEAITGTVGTVAMLIGVFALLGVLERSGFFEDVGAVLTRLAKKERSTEATIVLSVGILSMITGVISVAIVALGDLINEIGEKAGVNKYRRANLMDCTGCVFCFLAPWTVHCVIPAQLSAQFGEGYAVVPGTVPFVNYYSLCMLVILILSVVTGYGRKPPKGALIGLGLGVLLFLNVPAHVNAAETANDINGVQSENETVDTRPDYVIYVNSALNCITVKQQGEDGTLTPIRSMICSCGREGHETPEGTFQTSAYYEWRKMVDGTYGRYVVRFNGKILFHSVPYLEESPDSLEWEEYNKLGESASLGCVRMTVQDAKWIYDNCKPGTQVVVYSDNEEAGELGKPAAVKIDADSPNKMWDPTDTSILSPWVSGSEAYVPFTGTIEEFDYMAYADRYPDLKSVFGYDKEALYDHYITCGVNEGRIAEGK
ncbi:MAG: L,D-transpeptidase family protein [Roseburia sp.]|nr:L,D-transpeptidase family protein [Roseburia sp.]